MSWSRTASDWYAAQVCGHLVTNQYTAYCESCKEKKAIDEAMEAEVEKRDKMLKEIRTGHGTMRDHTSCHWLTDRNIPIDNRCDLCRKIDDLKEEA